MKIDNMILKTLVVGPLQVNCYILACLKSKEAGIIDPGGEPDRIITTVQSNGFRPVCIINTHVHTDHIIGNARLKKKYEIPLMIHSKDFELIQFQDKSPLAYMLGNEPSPLPDKKIEDKDVIEIGELKLQVIHTPGHTPGGICLLIDSIIFTGDTLFAGGIGRTDFYGGSYEEIVKSIKEKLFILEDEVTIFPGHGPTSTIGYEKINNPFL